MVPLPHPKAPQLDLRAVSCSSGTRAKIGLPEGATRATRSTKTELKLSRLAAMPNAEGNLHGGRRDVEFKTRVYAAATGGANG